MKIFKHIAELQNEIQLLKANGQSIGFVPTMGALHAGHISLVAASKKACSITVASIFVNPTQFNNQSDFDNYPITIDNDKAQLIAAACDILFLPSVAEMYPEPDTRTFEFDGIENVMEGQFRPGHFNGVAQIVSKLFDAVTPDSAFFGQKDFQQLAIIRKMVEKLNYNISIIGEAIIREEDGLAMSSRNVRLNAEQRKKALLLSSTLFELKNKIKNNSINEINNWVEEQFRHDETFKFEYFQIVNSYTLLPIISWDDQSPKTACIAVFVGDVRLIDNILL